MSGILACLVGLLVGFAMGNEPGAWMWGPIIVGCIFTAIEGLFLW